jgi:HlyD family type I secretion membrane fusion protein
MSHIAEIAAPPTGLRKRWSDLRAMFAGSEEWDEADLALPFLRTNRIITMGTFVVAAFFVTFLGWSSLAPLHSAMLAPGVVIVESYRKTIQHLEGGLVKAVLVKDGQYVKAGQPLLEMDNTGPGLALEELQDQDDGLAAQEARLVAERDDSPVIHFPAELLARGSQPKVAEAIIGEQTTFENRRDSQNQQIALLKERNEEDNRAIAGLRDQVASFDSQIALVQREADAVQKMVDKGLEPLPKLLDLQRQIADFNGQRGDTIEKISQQQLDIGENNIQIVNARSTFLEDVLKDLRDAQGKRFDLADRIQAARDVLKRTTLVAPSSGRVIELQVHTKGAVIRPGDPLMEIVPVHDRLVVEARVRPEDADDVYVGQQAKVDLSAYKARRLPMITGTVTYISADRMSDPKTGQIYFIAHVSIDRSALKNFPTMKFFAGMPVMVEMETGAHTAIEYFTEPLRDVMTNGMREK